MAMCVLCGKQYSRKVTDAHLKSHKVSRSKYDKTAAALTEEQWAFYWSHPGLQAKFPNPTATKPEKGKALTFGQWCAKVADRHPELA